MSFTLERGKRKDSSTRVECRVPGPKPGPRVATSKRQKIIFRENLALP